MIVSHNDSLKKKIKWYLITLLLDLLIVLFFWGLPFVLIYHNVILGLVAFLMGVFFSRKFISSIENYIGIACCLQNLNKHNLIRLDCTCFRKKNKTIKDDSPPQSLIFNKKTSVSKKAKKSNHLK